MGFAETLVLIGAAISFVSAFGLYFISSKKNNNSVWLEDCFTSVGFIGVACAAFGFIILAFQV